MMKVSAEEHAAILTVLELGRQHGFGNMIAHLRTAWMRVLIDVYGFDETSAEAASNTGPYSIPLHVDILENGEWDETGEKYKLLGRE